jgi:hypothetical protein
VVSRHRQRDGLALARRAEWRDTRDTRWSREARMHAGYFQRALEGPFKEPLRATLVLSAMSVPSHRNMYMCVAP